MKNEKAAKEYYQENIDQSNIPREHYEFEIIELMKDFAHDYAAPIIQKHNDLIAELEAMKKTMNDMRPDVKNSTAYYERGFNFALDSTFKMLDALISKHQPPKG